MVLYGSESRPEDDISPSGGPIDVTHRPIWYELSWPSIILIVSTDPADFRTVTITGRDVTGNAAVQAIPLNGIKRRVSAIEFIHVDKVEASATHPTARIFVVQNLGSLMLHDINPGELGGFRMFLNANASTTDPKSRYEKLFWKNTDDSDVPTLATVELSHDAIGKISIGLDAVVDGTQSVANRFLAPAGVTFVDDDVQIPVPGGTLAAGSAIGVWIKQTLLINDGPYDAFLGLKFCGDFPENDLLGCPEIQPPVCLFNCGPICCPPPPPPPPPGGTVAFIECGHTCPLGQEAFATITTALVAGGPAIRVTPTSTDLAFTGMVAVVIPAQNVLAMVLWTGQPIATFDVSQVITSASYTYVSGDVIKIASSEASQTSYSVTVNGVSTLAATIADATLNTANPCIGFIPVENPPTITIVEPEGDFDVILVKAADQSVDNGTTGTTLVDDDTLIVPMAAGEKWTAHFGIIPFAGDSVPDVKYTITAPVGATGKWFSTVSATERALDEVETLSLNNYSFPNLIVATVINGGSAGNMKLQFAQNTASATPTIMRAHSSVLAAKQS